MVERKYPVLFTPGWLRWVEGINADNRWEQIPEMGGLTTPDDEWPARYRLRTEIPVIDEDQLRQTGTEYHDLVRPGMCICNCRKACLTGCGRKRRN